MPDRGHGGSPLAVDLDALRADPALVDQLDGGDLQHDDHGGDHFDQLAYQTEPGRGLCVCHACIGQAGAAAGQRAAGLTPAERAELQAERDAGDRLANGAVRAGDGRRVRGG